MLKSTCKHCNKPITYEQGDNGNWFDLEFSWKCQHEGKAHEPITIMHPSLPAISPVPNTAGEMLSHSLRSEGDSPRKHWIAVMEYPDCTREFDGRNWKVIKDKRQQP